MIYLAEIVVLAARTGHGRAQFRVCERTTKCHHAAKQPKHHDGAQLMRSQQLKTKRGEHARAYHVSNDEGRGRPHSDFSSLLFFHHQERFFVKKARKNTLFSHYSQKNYILNTPNCCGGKGWFKDAAMPMANIFLVSMGSMMPSSQRRAVL